MANEQISLIIVEVSQQLYGLPGDEILDLFRLAGIKIAPIPGCKPPVLGVLKHREEGIIAVDARVLFGYPSFDEYVESLREMLMSREEDHVAWLNDLRHCCQTGAPFSKATDPHKCAFGKWYDTLTGSPDQLAKLTGNDPSILNLVSQFDAPHKNIHGIAEQALKLAKNDDLKAADVIIQKAWDTELAKMKTLFHNLTKLIVARRKPLAVVAQFGPKHTALIVDSVIAIESMDRSAIQQTGTLCDQSKLITGIYHSSHHGDVFTVDTAEIAETVTSRSLAVAA